MSNIDDALVQRVCQACGIEPHKEPDKTDPQYYKFGGCPVRMVDVYPDLRHDKGAAIEAVEWYCDKHSLTSVIVRSSDNGEVFYRCSLYPLHGDPYGAESNDLCTAVLLSIDAAQAKGEAHA